MKADEYRGLKAQVDGIDPKMQRLSNLKAAAQDALDRGDFDEVDEVLLSAQTIELEEAAKTAELRADTMLLARAGGGGLPPALGDRRQLRERGSAGAGAAAEVSYEGRLYDGLRYGRASLLKDAAAAGDTRQMTAAFGQGITRSPSPWGTRRAATPGSSGRRPFGARLEPARTIP